MESPQRLTQLKSADLAIHEQLIKIYGEEEQRDDLELDIAENGILVPLVVSSRTDKLVVVSGKCRHAIACKLNLPYVPAIVHCFVTEEAECHFVLTANRIRPKSSYQQLLEGLEWEAYEQAQARKRRLSGLGQRWEKEGSEEEDDPQYPMVLLPSATLLVCDSSRTPIKSPQRTVDRVGARIGISGRSYERARPVVKKCEELEANGKCLEAEALRLYLEANITDAANLLKSPDFPSVLNLIGELKAKTIAQALLKLKRKVEVKQVVEGAVFFFPERCLRKPTLYHGGRVGSISNVNATVYFRDTDNSVIAYQYKRDELLTLTLNEEPNQELRDRIFYLLSNTRLAQIERDILQLLLRPVFNVREEIEYLQMIELRTLGTIRQQYLAA